MQESQQDLFRKAMEKAQKTDSWDRLTTSQKEKLIARCLLDHYETSIQQQQ